MDNNTPSYYSTADGKDLYDIFLEQYGPDLLLAHLEMEVRQYAHRCIYKGQYLSDLHKINNITRRMIDILTDIEESRLDEWGIKAKIEVNK